MYGLASLEYTVLDQVLPVQSPQAAAGASVATEKPSYAAGEKVVVDFAGFPGNAADWITVVPADYEVTRWAQWFYLEGHPQGRLTFDALPAGDYEVRGYFEWPQGQYQVEARHSFTVR